MPVWSADAKRIAYSFAHAAPNIFWKAADGTGDEERLTTSENIQYPSVPSPDGQILAFAELEPTTSFNIWMLSLKDRRKSPFLQTPFNETNPVFSLDGHWLAYQSNETGRDEIYVQPFPGPGSRELVSIEGGTEPVWSRDGRQIVYRNGDKMMSVATGFQPAFHFSKPEVLFQKPYWDVPPFRTYDVTSDGRRFLMIKENEQVTAANTINIVLNWLEELKKKVP